VIARLIFDQISGFSGLLKLTGKINYAKERRSMPVAISAELGLWDLGALSCLVCHLPPLTFHLGRKL
jgi:hypothetical protein